jgi:hypothetical protein
MKYLKKLTKLSIAVLLLGVLVATLGAISPAKASAITAAESKMYATRIKSVCNIAGGVADANKKEDATLISLASNLCTYGPITKFIAAGGYDNLDSASKKEIESGFTTGLADSINQAWLIAISKGYLTNNGNPTQTAIAASLAADKKHGTTTVTSDATAVADCTTDSSAEGCKLDVNAFEGALGSTKSAEDCAGVKISFKIGCAKGYSNPIMAYLVGILRFLTYGVGLVVITMIIIGGIQYSAAGGNAQAVQSARNRILNALIALLLYIFAFAILNFLVPGGLLG